jgi:hypothetical protein
MRDIDVAKELVKDTGFEKLLTTREVAEILGVRFNHVRSLNLPWIKIRGRYKLEPKDLRKYMVECKKKGRRA